MWGIAAIIAFVVALFITEVLIKKELKIIMKINWIFYCVLPFVIFLVLCLPLMLAKIDFNIIYWVAAISMPLTFGIACSTLYNKYNVWTQKKEMKGK